MNAASVLIEYAVPVYGLHLDATILHSPIPGRGFLFGKSQTDNHPGSIVFVQRNRRFSMAAVSATFTLKYIRGFHAVPYPKGSTFSRRIVFQAMECTLLIRN
jgi:hypothetical protein